MNKLLVDKILNEKNDIQQKHKIFFDNSKKLVTSWLKPKKIFDNEINFEKKNQDRCFLDLPVLLDGSSLSVYDVNKVNYKSIKSFINTDKVESIEKNVKQTNTQTSNNTLNILTRKIKKKSIQNVDHLRYKPRRKTGSVSLDLTDSENDKDDNHKNLKKRSFFLIDNVVKKKFRK